MHSTRSKNRASPERGSAWARVAGAGLCVLLGACATVTHYQQRHDGLGYEEQVLESTRLRVSFTGSSKTPRETVENYLLYRAAELTLARGYDYFVMASSSTQAGRDSSPTLSFGIGGFGFGSRSGVGLGVGTSTAPASGVEYTAQAEIVLRKGAKPADDPRAFNAREVRENLESRIVRPSAS